MKVLFVGLGGIGQRHLRNFRRVLGEKLDPLAYRVRADSPVLTDTLEVEPGVDLATKYGLRTFVDYSQALDQAPDLVIVSNPSSLHVATARAAVQRGINVFVEKPLSHSADGVAELVSDAESTGAVGLVGYQLRFHPCLERVDAILRDRLLGRVLSVNAHVGEYLPGWHKYEDYRQMYAARAELGGGVILSQIHEFDYLYWLFGMPSRLFTCGGHLSDLELDVEDVASSVMQIELDGTAVPVLLHQDYVQRPPSRGLEIIGTRGKLALDLVATRLIRYGEEGDVAEAFEPAGFQRNDLFLSQTRHTVSCIQRGEKPRVSLRDGAKSLLLALAARASMSRGDVIDVRAFAGSVGLGSL
jgi:predicted dehydrogenase